MQFLDEIVETLVVVERRQTRSSSATLFNVSETHHHFPRRLHAFFSSGTKLAQDTLTFLLHDARNSPYREWTKPLSEQVRALNTESRLDV